MPFQSFAPRAAALLVTAGLALSATLLVQEPARAAVTQGVAGTVTFSGDGGSRGGAGIRIEPVDPTAKHYENVAIGTEPDGTFAFSLPVGEYWIRFHGEIPGFSSWAPEWAGDSPTRGGSTKVIVKPGEVTQVDAELEPGGRIGGTVPAGPMRDGRVEILAPDATFPGGYAPVGIGWVEDDGDYQTSSLPPGDYLVHFFDTDAKTEGWWDDQGSRSSAQTVNVVRGATTGGVDAKTLTAWGTITGKLINVLDGQPVGGTVNVAMISPEGSWGMPGWGLATVIGGTFQISMPAGGYRIFGGAYPFKNRVWGAPAGSNAWYYLGSDVLVSSGQTISGIDIVLTPNDVSNQELPRVSGTYRTGSALVADNGDWRPSGLAFTGQWERDGLPIPGATARTYVLKAADVGHRVGYRATASFTLNGTTVSRSARSYSWTAYYGYLRQTLSATLSGLAAVGSTLRLTPPRTSPTAAHTTYRWLRDGKPIPGATRASYRATAADRGHRIGVRVTLTKPGFHTLTRVLTRTQRVF